MKPTIRLFTPASRSAAVAAAFLLAASTVAPAAGIAATADPAAITAPLHGGAVTKTAAGLFETALAADGVRVWFYSAKGSPMGVEKAGGKASLKLPDGRSLDLTLAARQPAKSEAAIYYCPMHAEVVQREPGKCKLCGGMNLYTQDYLFAAADLAKVAPSAVTAQIRLTGLDGAQKEATFAPIFTAPPAGTAPQKTGK